MARGAPAMRLVGALDQLVAALGQHLDGDVVGDQVFLDQLAHEVEVGLARRREPDLDLLEAHRHEGLEHAPLALRVHRVDERLVAVAEVDRAPPGRLGELLVGPGAVGQLERHERAGTSRTASSSGCAGSGGMVQLTFRAAGGVVTGS